VPGSRLPVLLIPVTPATTGLADAWFLGLMHDGALLVNAARGSIVDTGALLAELTTGRLRAALDVTDPEPLPPGHPLWSAPGLLRFAAGQPLRHVVGARGY
jgi:phosphoglycerate dehydrogenase-like enzyme